MKQEKNDVKVIDAKGYYAEQFLCRQTQQAEPEVRMQKEEILENIYLAVNLVESVSNKKLNAAVLDISTDVSGIPAQLMMRGFKNVSAIPETEVHLKKLKSECKVEGWGIAMDMGIQPNLKKLKADAKAGSFDVITIMDSNFGRFTTREEQKAVIEKCASMLVKDGVIVLDLSNPVERIRKMPRNPVWSEDESTFYLWKETIDPLTLNYVSTMIEIAKKTGKQTRRSEEGVLIPLVTLEELLTGSGFKIKNVFGNYEQTPLVADSTRMIVVAEVVGGRGKK